MWTTLTTLLLATLPLGLQQDVQEGPTFLIETVSASDLEPLAACEILVLETAEDFGADDLTDFFLHGMQMAERLEADGTRYRTDAAGRVKIPVPAGDFMVSATHDSGLVAYRGWVDPQFEGHLRLFLHEPRIAEVRCVDAGDKPLRGVPVNMSPVGIPISLSRATTDEDGFVRFPHLGLYETAAEQGFFANLELIVATPLPSPPRVSVSDALTTGPPVTFRLPDLGTVEIEIPAGWRPTGSQVSALSLQLHAGAEVSSIAPIPVGADEAAVLRFPHVGLGLQLSASILDGERRAEPYTFSGPSEPGQVVRTSLDLPLSQPGWAMRAIDESGAPISDTEFRGWFESWHGGSGGSRKVAFRSNVDGVVDLPILEEDPEDGTHRLFLRMAHEEAPRRLEMRVEAKDLLESNAESPLAVTFKAPHVVAEGVLVDADGVPVSGATVRATRPRGSLMFVAMAGEPPVHAQEPTTGEDGRFTVWSADERSPLAVFSERGGYDLGELRGVQNGAADLRVVMQRNGEVVGHILLDENVSPYSLSIGLRSEEFGNDSDQPDENGRFQFGAVRNGKATLRIRAMNGYTNFYAADIVIRNGRLVDPSKVEEIDLRGKIYPIGIEVELLDGQECDGFTIRPKGADFNPRCEAWGDFWTLLLDSVPADLEISKPGYRTVTLEGVRGDQVVEFVPGPPVEISVDHPEWIPNGWQLKAYLKSPNERGDFGKELLLDGVTAFSLTDPGRYSVRVSLSNEDGWNRGTVCETTFETAEEGTTVVKLKLDEKAVREAVEG